MTAWDWKLVEYAVWGLLGGLIGAMVKTRRLTLPQILIEQTRGGVTRRVIDVGFLTAPFMGAVIAAAIDGRPLTAVAFGITAGWAGPAFVNVIADATLGMLGYLVKAIGNELERAPGGAKELTSEAQRSQRR